MCHPLGHHFSIVCQQTHCLLCSMVVIHFLTWASAHLPNSRARHRAPILRPQHGHIWHLHHIGGQWAGQLAGGSRSHPTWGSNPQYLLSCQRATTAVISLTRPRPAEAPASGAHPVATDMGTAAETATPAALPAAQEQSASFGDPDAFIGLTIATPEESSEGLGRRAALLHEADVLAESGHGSCEEAVLVLALQPGTTYLLVPSTAAPGVDGCGWMCCIMGGERHDCSEGSEGIGRQAALLCESHVPAESGYGSYAEAVLMRHCSSQGCCICWCLQLPKQVCA